MRTQQTDWRDIADHLAKELRDLRQQVERIKLRTSPIQGSSGLDVRMTGVPNFNSERWRSAALRDYKDALEQEASPIDAAFEGGHRLLSRIVELEYNDGNNRPLKEVAAELGISLSWARRLRSRAYDRLREYFRDGRGNLPFSHSLYIGRILYNAPAETEVA